MNRRIRNGTVLAAALTIVALTLAGCTAPAPSDDAPAELDTTPTELPAVDCVEPDPAATLTPVSLQLQWLAQAQFAGYYAADCLGYFAEQGLDVTIVPLPGFDAVPQNILAEGQADYAVAWVPKVLGSIEASGLELTNIAQIFQYSGTMQVAYADSGIESVADFEGSAIGSWGFGNEWEIFAAMTAEGVDTTSVEIVQQAFDMSALLNGDVDAAEAMSYNEWAQVLETENPDEPGTLYTEDDFSTINYADTRGGMLQDAIWARTSDLADPAFEAQTVAFLTAALKGWIYTRDNPEEGASIAYAAALDAIAAVEEDPDAGLGAFPVGPGHQLWQMNEVNKLVWPSSQGIGIVDANAWAQTVEGALASTNQDGQKLITVEPAESTYTNDYVLQALAALEAEGLDTTGEGFTPITVILKLGGI
ncbi:MAG TPA: ABC transporter substrate-binding protein [Pseudolysinimonas sp.]|nr:ABC transporter substrate-binding protein [Pseudolysinimonas sp.]